MNILIEHQSDNFNMACVTAILSHVEDYLISVQENLKLKRTVFAISIEALQNMAKHQSSSASSSVSFSLYHGVGGYRIQTSNSIKSIKKEALKNKLNHLGTLTLAELKEQYQHFLKNRPHTLNGSAGLGLIQMTRKSKEKLEYEFVDLNEELTQFQLTVSIKK